MAEPTAFRSGREFAAFLGLVPRQTSSGGKERLGRITKMGDGYPRKLLVVGATAVVRRARTGAFAAAPWLRALLERRPARVASVAMANKTARIVWAVLREKRATAPRERDNRDRGGRGRRSRTVGVAKGMMRI